MKRLQCLFYPSLLQATALVAVVFKEILTSEGVDEVTG